MTGLTLPGMMLEPACIGGKLISPRPTRGPDDNRRRSLQVFDSLTATRFNTPESCTKAPQSCVASIRLTAVKTGIPVISRRRWQDRGRSQIDLADQRQCFLETHFILAEHDGVS
jgi:hypothetical protein